MRGAECATHPSRLLGCAQPTKRRSAALCAVRPYTTLSLSPAKAGPLTSPHCLNALGARSCFGIKTDSRHTPRTSRAPEPARHSCMRAHPSLRNRRCLRGREPLLWLRTLDVGPVTVPGSNLPHCGKRLCSAKCSLIRHLENRSPRFTKVASKRALTQDQLCLEASPGGRGPASYGLKQGDQLTVLCKKRLLVKLGGRGITVSKVPSPFILWSSERRPCELLKRRT